MLIFNDRLEINEFYLSIQFSNIKNIESIDKKDISKLRLLGLGLIIPPYAIRTILNKNSFLTSIEFEDNNDKKIYKMLFDFDKSAEKIHPLIYTKIQSFKKNME
jgi:hypothetical protein